MLTTNSAETPRINPADNESLSVQRFKRPGWNNQRDSINHWSQKRITRVIVPSSDLRNGKLVSRQVKSSKYFNIIDKKENQGEIISKAEPLTIANGFNGASRLPQRRARLNGEKNQEMNIIKLFPHQNKLGIPPGSEQKNLRQRETLSMQINKTRSDYGLGMEISSSELRDNFLVVIRAWKVQIVASICSKEGNVPLPFFCSYFPHCFLLRFFFLLDVGFTLSGCWNNFFPLDCKVSYPFKSLSCPNSDLFDALSYL